MSTPTRIAWLALLLAACGEPPAPGRPDARDATDARDAAPDERPDVPPLPTAVCGDGELARDEACDDGNTNDGDGCTAACVIERGFVCPRPGMLCQRTIECGDGRVDTGEACDDRNAMPGDGCDARCQLEPGWTCPRPGVACRAALCGDGLRVDDEECDDGDAMAGDGCGANCRLEEGYQCPTPGAECSRTRCGDTRVEGTEECDDGNNVLGDGCDPFCRREPRCADGACMPVCGDGVKLPGEGCDDGNTRSGDGCSAACVPEMGFRCMDTAAMEPATLSVPIVYRDFRGVDLPGGHPDFQWTIGAETGIVAATLTAAGRIQYARASGGTATTRGRAAFDQWYADVPMVNRTIVARLALTRTGAGIYVFDDPAFFPLDGRGWMSDGMEPARDGGHNFHFTSELRYWFAYAGGEQLTFRGDDDVWVFINGRLAVDLGGVHGAMTGGVTLDAAAATTYGLRAGGIYEAVVFQAERHTTESSYRLTLARFNAPRSTCTILCGDGVVTRFEACDDGVNDGRYGGCMPGCLMRAPRCGDGTLQRDEGETCDDGNTRSDDGCSAMCREESVG